MQRTKGKPSQINWKQNLLKIPNNIRAKLDNLTSNDIIVACMLKINIEDIKSGKFQHVGINWADSGISSLSEILPSPEIGRYSKKNVCGYEMVYKDKPKTTKTWSIDAPNYGDSTKGYHSVDFSKPVYQREVFAPKFLTIKINHIAEDLPKQAHVIRFTVQEVLNRHASDFEDSLLFNLNLLQENTGNHDIYDSKTSLEEYLKTLYVNWEILPPGEREETLMRILGTKNSDPKVRLQVTERYNFLGSLHPRNFIRGINEFRQYFGAQFADDLHGFCSDIM